jgi:hypothetical protein
VDYKKFLQQAAKDEVLPYWGGPHVYARDRRLRVKAPGREPGWFQFKVSGRDAVLGARTDAPDLSALPRVRGHLWGERLVQGAAVCEPVWFLPEEQAPRFAPVACRRWPSGDLVFDQLEFEGDAEEAVRRALEDEAPLEDVKGASSALRAAYGYALVQKASDRLKVPVLPAEVRLKLQGPLTQGRAGADALVRAIDDERQQTFRELEALRQKQAEQAARAARAREAVAQADARANAPGLQGRERWLQDDRAQFGWWKGEADARAQIEQRVHAQPARGRFDPAEAEKRIDQVLDDAGARMASARYLGRNEMETIFSFMGERFICVVRADTLQVIDSGICLGHPPRDDLVTLASLPSVIKEAIDEGCLVVLRRP